MLAVHYLLCNFNRWLSFPHMLIGRVWIYRLLFVCQILHDGSWASWAWNLSHFGELCSPEAKNPTNRRAAASIADRRQSPSDGALAVSGGDWRLSAILALGMCGYTAFPRRRTYLFVCNFCNFVCLYGYGFLRRG